MDASPANLTAESDKSALTSPTAKSRWRWCRHVRLLFWLAVILIPVGCKLDSFFYHPDSVTYFSPRDFSLTAGDVYFDTPDGEKLHGWWIPATTPAPALGTIVHFHGNAANITNHIAVTYWLPPAGYNLLMFDYRGYGQSTGRTTRAGTVTDGIAAIDYALTRQDVDPQRLFAYGHSLGGAIAIAAAAERPQVRGVIAEETFGQYRRLGARHLCNRIYVSPLANLIAWGVVTRGHDPEDVIAKISPRPVLIIGGEKDPICFPEESQKLFDAAKEPKELWIVPGAGHYAVLDVAAEELKRRICGFLKRAAEDGR